MNPHVNPHWGFPTRSAYILAVRALNATPVGLGPAHSSVRILIPFWFRPQMKRAYPSPRRSEAVSERLLAASGVLFAEALRASTNPLVAHLRSIGMVLPLERQRLIARQPGLAEASSLSSVQNQSSRPSPKPFKTPVQRC
jgi:hypothetical protein